MGYKAPILVCVLYLLGSICFVVGIVSPSWSYTIYNSASVTVGIWTQCYKDGQLDCVPPVQGDFLIVGDLRILAATAVALLCVAAILKILWAAGQFQRNILGIFSSALTLIAGFLGVATYALYTQANTSDLNYHSWAATLTVMAAIFLVVVGVLGAVIIATSHPMVPEHQEGHSDHKQRSPLVSLIQQTPSGTPHTNYAFTEFDANMNSLNQHRTGKVPTDRAGHNGHHTLHSSVM